MAETRRVCCRVSWQNLLSLWDYFENVNKNLISKKTSHYINNNQKQNSQEQEQIRATR